MQPRPSSWRVYGAYGAVLVAIGISFATMIANDVMLTDHYNLRGPVLALRLFAAGVAAAVVGAPWAALAWWLVRGMDRSQRVGALLLCWLVSLPAAHFGLDAANVVLATAEARTHTVVFVRTQSQRKGSDYSVISSWEEPGETVGLTTGLRFGLLTPGAPIEVDVRRGALGWTYIASARFSPTSESLWRGCSRCSRPTRALRCSAPASHGRHAHSCRTASRRWPSRSRTNAA